MSRPAVFLDRDGTLIEERGYLDRLELLALFPFSSEEEVVRAAAESPIAGGDGNIEFLLWARRKG